MKCYAGHDVDRDGGCIIPVCFCHKTAVGELLCWSCGRHGWMMDYSGMFL